MRLLCNLFIAAFVGFAMTMLHALPANAQDDGDYGDLRDEHYADSYREGDPNYSRHDRPYVAYSFAPKHKPYHDEGKHYNGYKPPYYAAYSHGPRYRKPYPRWRKTCVYGPLREKKICDYEPRHCWKERECYYVHGKKYCRYYTKCRGGERRCYWVKKPYHGGPSCGERY
jgi:hypothetical protein